MGSHGDRAAYSQGLIMLHASDTFLAELGLERSGPRPDQWGDDPGRHIWRAGLTHPVLQRMLATAEQLAPVLRLTPEVVFGLLRDLVIEESERSPYGLVAREPEAEPAMAGSLCWRTCWPRCRGWPTPGTVPRELRVDDAAGR
jgi:hypothetical protein